MNTNDEHEPVAEGLVVVTACLPVRGNSLRLWMTNYLRSDFQLFTMRLLSYSLKLKTRAYGITLILPVPSVHTLGPIASRT